VRRDPHQHSAFTAGLEHQVQVSMFQVADAAVNQPRGTTGCSTRKVARFEQCHAKSAQRRVSRNAGPGNAAANDGNVE
jgi:hypothetical protein